MSAVLLAEVRDWGGEQAVNELLELAVSERTAEYLTDITNWISSDEAVALWRAGAQLTHNPQFSQLVGRRAAQRLAASPVATLLRSLGSPENVYQQIAVTASKFSTVVRMQAIEVGPGFAEIAAAPVDGFVRSPEHCAWTIGLLSCTPMLFGLSSSHIEHDQCAAFGAPECVYRISWETELAPTAPPSDERVTALRGQLAGMHGRLHSMFATASDLIAADDIADVLARIIDRAAVEVRAPRYLLSVKLVAGGEIHRHHRGFDESEAERYASQLLEDPTATYPESWLVVPVRSDRREYGRLLAASDADARFLPQERELFEVYARYAASALDGAAALIDAKQRNDESRALLRLARALAGAGTSAEIAQRLAEAVLLVVDCDRVGVHLWEPGRGELVRRAIANRDPGDPRSGGECSRAPTPGDSLERLLNDPHHEPILIAGGSGDPRLQRELRAAGEAAAIHVPIATDDALLGVLTVSVLTGPDRLTPSPDLLNRLSGVAAQASTALQNGRLVDRITHQALHDQLTGLANRLQFTDLLRKAVNRARRRDASVTVFYIDLDDFKPVNDEFGHDIGDQLLAALGGRLRACTRGNDTVARLGGDEFAVLIEPWTSPADAQSLLERLAAVFEDPFEVDGRVLHLTASIGQAVFPDDADSADRLLRHADASMFEAKRGQVNPR